jgi:hypothetical protein
MEWPDASNFACLISGYYKLFVDPKRAIYYRTPGQSYMIKAGMLVVTSLSYTAVLGLAMKLYIYNIC